MVIAVDDVEAPSRRVVVVVASAIAALFVVLVVGSVALQGFGTINGHNEVAAVGEPISVRVDNGLDIRVDMTVTEVSLVTGVQAARTAKSAADVYVVRYEVRGIDEISPDTDSALWRLVDEEGTVYTGTTPAGSPPENCGAGESDGCVVISVPAGTVVTMVRYYGVKTFWYQGKPTASEVWAGWAA